MIHRYIKQLGLSLNEAADPSQTTYDNAVKKYEDAKKKNEEQYQQYTLGKTTKEQYMTWFNQFLEMTKEFMTAQVNYKLDSARQAMPGSKPAAAGQTSQTTPATPGNGQMPNIPG